MKNTRVLLVAVTTLSLAGMASATVVVSDSFNRVTGSGDTNGNPAGVGAGFSSWGAADNALGGSLAMPWTVEPTRTGGRNQLTDGAWGSLWEGVARGNFDASTLAPEGFTLEVDFDRLYGNSFRSAATAGNGFLALGVGYDASTNPGIFAATTATNFAILFQQPIGSFAGNAQVFANGVQVGGPAAGGEGALDYGDPAGVHSLLLTFTPDVVGAYGAADSITVDVLIDGTESYSTSVLGGTGFGNLIFSANAAGGAGGNEPRGVDNLVITAIPEPGSAALLGLSAVAMLRRRG